MFFSQFKQIQVQLVVSDEPRCRGAVAIGEKSTDRALIGFRYTPIHVEHGPWSRKRGFLYNEVVNSTSMERESEGISMFPTMYLRCLIPLSYISDCPL